MGTTDKNNAKIVDGQLIPSTAYAVHPDELGRMEECEK